MQTSVCGSRPEGGSACSQPAASCLALAWYALACGPPAKYAATRSSIQPPDRKSCPQVGLPNGFIAQLTSPSWFGSTVTAANGAIVSCPATISSAAAGSNRGSPPHARAAPDAGG